LRNHGGKIKHQQTKCDEENYVGEDDGVGKPPAPGDGETLLNVLVSRVADPLGILSHGLHHSGILLADLLHFLLNLLPAAIFSKPQCIEENEREN